MNKLLEILKETITDERDDFKENVLVNSKDIIEVGEGPWTDLRNIVFHKYPGTKINLTIVRKGQIIEESVILSTRPEDKDLFGSYEIEDADFDLLGLKIITDENNKISIKEVKKDSSSEKENIKSGDIITQIDDKNIENIEDYYDAIANIQSDDIVLIGITTINQSKNFSQTYSRYIAIKVD